VTIIHGKITDILITHCILLLLYFVKYHTITVPYSVLLHSTTPILYNIGIYPCVTSYLPYQTQTQLEYTLPWHNNI
jgi:hypothetical protein